MSPRNIGAKLRIFFVLVALFALTAVYFGIISRTPSQAAAQTSTGISPFIMNDSTGGAKIKLQEPYALSVESDTAAPSDAEPRGLATADFDRDGFPDLVSAYSAGDGGFLNIQRGNPESFAPTLPENVENTNDTRYGVTFLATARTIKLATSPDFVATGDFDNDQNVDLLTAQRGDSKIYFVGGDGDGSFRAAKAIALPGVVTALTAGQADNPDVFGKAVVAVSNGKASSLLVFNFGLENAATSYELPAPADALAIGQIDDNVWGDVVMLSEGRVLVLHGRDMRAAKESAAGRNSRIEEIALPYSVAAFAIGQFVWDREGLGEIAVLRGDGSVDFLVQDNLDTRPFTPEEVNDRRRRQKLPADDPESLVRVNHEWNHAKTASWTPTREVAVMSAAAVTSAKSATAPVIFNAQLSGQNADDLVVLDGQTNSLRVFAVEAPVAEYGRAVTYDGERRELALPAGDAPVAALAMRTSLFVRQGLVYLRNGDTSAQIAPSAPSATFSVTKTTDTNDGACNADCSLREAHVAANSAGGADQINVGAGTYTLTITGNDDGSATGDLDATDSVTISGAGAASTIIQAGTTSSNGIDKVFGINPLCNAVSATVSNVTVRFGNNTQPNGSPDFSHTSGGLDYCGGGASTVAVTNSTFDQNTVNNSYGGGVGLDSLAPSTSNQQLTNLTVTNNDTINAGTAGGGGVNVYGDQSVVTISGSTISGNRARTTGTDGIGGGVAIRLTNGGSVTITGSTISNNNSSSSGGGVAIIPSSGTSSSSITSTTISGNTSNGNGTNAIAQGGGIYLSSLSSGSNTFNKLTITGNTATVAAPSGISRGGGGIFFSTNNGTTSISFSRFANNVAATGLGTGAYKDANSGNVTATNNWWGCSTGPTATPCDTAINQSGSPMTSTPYLRFTNTAATSPIVVGQTSVLTTSALTNSAGTAIAASNLDVLIGQTVTWGSPTLGTLSGQQTTVQAAGTATATFTATTAGTTGGATATVDNGGVATSPAITVNKANTTTTITADTPDPSVVGQSVTVSYTVAVSSPGSGTPTGIVTVSDGTNTCNGTVAAGQCSLTINISGPKTLTATYAGDSNFNSSASSGVSHTVNGTFVWSGTADSVYSNNANWSTGLAPGSGATVSIPSGAPNQPTLSGPSSLASLTVASGSTLTVNSNLIVTSLTNNGTIKGTGTIVNNFSNGGSVAPGNSPGILNVTGTYANTGSLDIEIGGIGGAGVNPNGHDQLLVSSTATLGGTLNVTLTNGYSPVNGATFVIFDAASLTGTFSTVNLPTLPRGQFDVTYNNAAGTVTLTAAIPSAAGVSIAGRVLDPSGRAISRARVTISDFSGRTRTFNTNTFGYYEINDVAAGQIYTMTVGAKSYTFTPRIIDISDSITDLDFIAEP